MTPAAPQAVAPEALTEDAFLDGALKLLQPERGYRAATDPVLLAAASAVETGRRVLDVGCGVGTAAFCLEKRVGGLDLHGIELQPDLAALSERNAARNAIPAWRVHRGDLADPPAALKALSFDHVISNPPYAAAAAGPASPVSCRDLANRETLPLAVWIDFCLRRLRPGGALTLIHRIERLPEILAALSGRAGAIAALPLQPREGAPAKRAIVRAVKESRGPFRLAPPFLLHRGAGDAAPFTPEAEAVLRVGAPLRF